MFFSKPLRLETMYLDPDKKFDKRNLKKGLSNGGMTEKNFRVYLSELPDVGSKLFSRWEEGVRDQGPQTRHGSAMKRFEKRSIKEKPKKRRKP